MKVLLVGAGYVGGAVLEALRPLTSYELVVTARQTKQLETLTALGVNTIRLSLDDANLIESAVTETDVVINTASSDHLASVEATLKGIQNRIDAGKKTIYIHTSGTGVLMDLADGNAPSDRIFYDNRPEQFDTISPGAPHRAIDIIITQHAAKWHKTGLVEIRIMCPPLIYGQSRGPFKTVSLQIPSIIRASIKEGYAGVHGKGTPIWSHVHVNDLAQGYHVLLDSLVKDGAPKSVTPEDVYVFCEQGTEHEWIKVSEQVGKSLQQRGIISSSVPKPWPHDKLEALGVVVSGKIMGSEMDWHVVGSNSRSRAIKLRELGWKPTHSVTDFYESIDEDVNVILKELQQ